LLLQVISGYNCTIFAYGQTGTGKTYTMSGDMTEQFGMMSDAAGIIPRVLNALFNKLEEDDTESAVRCSFIELYNEELRDLLSADDGKLKIYDDNSRKGHATTVVQGMEERHITSATDGLKWLQQGSVRRQVAATKCNDLSSRSHTVFTININIKRTGEDGEEYLSAGKLNLVDLAGSENIQRSGAENKRAAEAGLINKSLLTLGRVINALVDRSQHIPYRESKLTRLLQDSLGGRTKTCIIATISPAKSNLEETISTLDYAFRAKNIKNKPQVNAMINKKTLLREFSAEIEKLKSELIATRQRNGVYLSNEDYEEITAQNESRRILTDEQAAKIETLEHNLRNKVQDLFTLNSSFMGLKKDHEGTKAQLDETKDVLDQTELVLAATRKMLAEETHIRKAHQQTEEKLSALGGELLTTLKKTVEDVGGLYAKNKRKSDLQMLNRSTWSMSQGQVADVTELVEGRIQAFRTGQEDHITQVSRRMEHFVTEELSKLNATQEFLDEHLAQFGESKKELLQQKEKSKDDMDNVLEEIKVVRDNIKERVGESLQAIAAAAERIAADVLSELDTFHNQLHTSYSTLGKDFKTIFEDMVRQMNAQKNESDRLRRQLEGTGDNIVQSNEAISARIQEVVEQERKQAAEERTQLLSQIAGLITDQAQHQENRLAGKTALIQKSVLETNLTFQGGMTQFSTGMDAWNKKEAELVDEVNKSKTSMRKKMKDDWTVCLRKTIRIDTYADNDIRPPTRPAPRSKTPRSPYTKKRFA
jgi:kinesin family protein 11